MNECWFSSDWRQISLSRKKLSSNLRLDVALIDGLEVCHWNIFESEIHIFAPEIFDKEISGDDVLVSSLPVGSLWSHLSDQHSQVRPDSEGRSRMLEMFWSARKSEVITWTAPHCRCDQHHQSPAVSVQFPYHPPPPSLSWSNYKVEHFKVQDSALLCHEATSQVLKAPKALSSPY